MLYRKHGLTIALSVLAIGFCGSTFAVDSDGDGLDDALENILGTDPTNPDTDGDDLSDGVETDTGVFVSAIDTGTDPLDADTDEDSLLDGLEVLSIMSNPLNADTDGDMALDGVEYDILNTLFPADPQALVGLLPTGSMATFEGTNVVTTFDSDGDGLKDFDELPLYLGVKPFNAAYTASVIAPEPQTYAIMGSFLLTLGFVRRRATRSLA